MTSEIDSYIMKTHIPLLPESLQLDEELANTACPWLNEYIAFSQRWSPRSYEGFHEVVGIWVLSTIAAGRVGYHFGNFKLSSLSAALVAPSGLFAKTTTAGIGKGLIRETGLESLLLPDEITPQKMLQMMSCRLPEDYLSLSNQEKKQILTRNSLAGQRGMFVGEFGGHLGKMRNQTSYFADFRSILREIDDNPPTYQSSTISRGTDRVVRPYISLLGLITDGEFTQFGKKGSGLWKDGYFARVLFSCPPTYAQTSNQQFPKGERLYPATLTEPLKEWNERLANGITHHFDILSGMVEPFDPVILGIDDDVHAAVYAYIDALTVMIQQKKFDELSRNYPRFADKALRLAALFASLCGSDSIQMKHWAGARMYMENMRFSLHELYNQVNTSDDNKSDSACDRIIAILDNFTYRTLREIQQYGPMKKADAEHAVEILIENGSIVRIPRGKTEVYALAYSSPAERYKRYGDVDYEEVIPY